MATGTLGTQAKDYPAREQKIVTALTTTNVQAGNNVKLGTVPAGSVLLRATTVVGTAFTAATTVALGNAAGGAQIMAAATVAAAAITPQTIIVGPTTSGPFTADTQIWLTPAGTPAAGAGVLVIEFAVPGST